MQLFEVWAPGAQSVSVVWGEPGWSFTDAAADVTTTALTSADDGWWRVKVFTSRTQVDYGFRLDDGPLRPDPRSAWQPRGVHDVSRTFSPEPVDPSWAGREARGAVFYELHVGTFTPDGTLDSAVELLPYLADLGVTMIQLMPVAGFNGEYGWGYDGVALYAVHHAYGGPEALSRFVAASHALGMGVSLDVVYNHLGPSGNYLAEFGPYFTAEHTTPWGQAVNLCGPKAAMVRRFIVENAERWFEDFGIDCLRLDAVHELYDDSDQHLLAQLSQRVQELSARLGRPLSLVAESDRNDPKTVAAVECGGLGMTAQWNDDFHHALHAVTSGERHGYYEDFGTIETLAHVLTDVFWHNNRWSSFRQQPWGAPVAPETTDGLSFLAYSLSHDQVGNRAAGDRPSSYLTTGQLALRAACVALGPFTPQLFMGEEWGALTPWKYFVSHPEPELARAVRRGRRQEFSRHGWSYRDIADPTASSSFTDSRLRWDVSRDVWQIQLWQWYQKLFALRAAEPALHGGLLSNTHTIFDDDEKWLVMLREHFAVVFNFGATPTTVPLQEATEGSWAAVLDFGGFEFVEPANSGDVAVSLPAHSCVVVRESPVKKSP